jgi:hypothetical protein
MRGLQHDLALFWVQSCHSLREEKEENVSHKQFFTSTIEIYEIFPMPQDFLFPIKELKCLMEPMERDTRFQMVRLNEDNQIAASRHGS